MTCRMTTHRNFGLPHWRVAQPVERFAVNEDVAGSSPAFPARLTSELHSSDRHAARPLRDAIQTRNVIQFARQVHPPANGVVNSQVSRSGPFISSPFKRGIIAQAAIDCLMVVFGTFFCCVFTVGLSAGIYSLLVFIVD